MWRGNVDLLDCSDCLEEKVNNYYIVVFIEMFWSYKMSIKQNIDLFWAGLIQMQNVIGTYKTSEWTLRTTPLYSWNNNEYDVESQ